MTDRHDSHVDPALAELDARMLVEHLPVGVLVLGTGAPQAWASDALLVMLDSDRDEWNADPLRQALELIESPEPFSLPHRDGKSVTLRRKPVELPGTGGRAWCFLDVTRETELARRLAELDANDSETGLPNSSSILSALDKHVTRSRRYGNPLAVIRVRFQPNEPDAEAAKTLRNVSREFRAQLRWADEIGRLDRNSFLLILPETSEDNARMLATKLETERVAEATRWHLEMSVAAWQKGDDRRKLLSRAGWQPAA